MADIKPDEISAILRQQLSNFNASADLEEVGTVLQVGDGIARVYGLNGVRSGELVEFENGTKAIALNLEEDNVGVVLMGESGSIKEGAKVKRTGKIASIKVGEGVVGGGLYPFVEPVAAQVEHIVAAAGDHQLPAGVGGRRVHIEAVVVAQLRHFHRGQGKRVAARAGDVDVFDIVQVGAGQAGPLDDRGVLDVVDARGPPDVEGRDARPCQLRRLLDHGLVTLPGYRGQDAHDRTLDAGEGEQRQVGDELGQRLVEAALFQDLVELVFRHASAALGLFLGRLTGTLHQLHGAISDGVDVGLLTHHRHRLHLELHEFVHRLHDLRWDLRVVAGVEPPGAVRRQVDIAQERGRAAALHRDDAGVDRRAVELLDLAQLLGVVLVAVTGGAAVVVGGNRHQESFFPGSLTRSSCSASSCTTSNTTPTGSSNISAMSSTEW